MICKECGNEILPGTLFCTNCGAKADSTAQGADSDKTVVLWDDEPQQPKQDDDRTVVLWDEEPQQPQQDDDRTVVLWDEEPQQPKQDDDRTVVLWDDEPQQQQTNNGVAMCCPNCGANNVGDALFCVECGALMTETKQKPQQPVMSANPVPPIVPMTPPPVQQEQTPKKMEAPKQPKQPMPAGDSAGNKNIAIIIGMVAAAVVLVIGANFVIGGLSEKNIGRKLVYLKDNEMYIAEGGKYVPSLITEDYFADKREAEYVSISTYSRMQYTEDKKYLFYVQNYENGEFDLYYKKAGSDKEGIELEKGIDSFKVYSENLILYRKNDKLYCGNLKESEKVASDVQGFGVSKNGKYIYWMEYGDEGYDYYIQDASLKNDNIRIKKVSSMVSMNENYSEIYYLSDDTLYLMKNLKDKIKISSDVELATKLGGMDSETLYYFKLEDENSYTYYDMVKDDVNEDYDYIREDLEYYDFDIPEYTIYSYSAKTDKSEEVASMCGEEIETIWNADYSESIILYVDIDVDKMDKVKLSDVIDDYYYGYSDMYLDDIFEYNVLQQASYYLLTENGIVTVNEMGELFEDIGKVEPDEFLVNSVTEEIYMSVCYDMDDEGYTYDLYIIPYSEKETECKLITNDLFPTMYNAEQGVWYLCDVDEDGEEGVLYLNGVEMDEDVYPYNMVCTETETYYLKDINSDHDEGTLYVNKQGKVTEVAEDVANSSVVPIEDGCVAYLVDYSYKKYEGDLFVFNGRKNIAVDTEVSAIMR